MPVRGGRRTLLRRHHVRRGVYGRLRSKSTCTGGTCQPGPPPTATPTQTPTVTPTSTPTPTPTNAPPDCSAAGGSPGRAVATESPVRQRVSQWCDRPRWRRGCRHCDHEDHARRSAQGSEQREHVPRWDRCRDRNGQPARRAGRERRRARLPRQLHGHRREGQPSARGA